MVYEKIWSRYSSELRRITKHNRNRRFGQKKPKIRPESCKLNGNIFSEIFFLIDLDEKMISTGYRRQKNQKQSETVIIYSNYSPWRTSRTRWKSFLLDNFSLRSQQHVPNYFVAPTNVLTSISERFGHNFQFWANNHFPDIDRHHDWAAATCMPCMPWLWWPSLAFGSTGHKNESQSPWKNL